jgi:hypothetical protein
VVRHFGVWRIDAMKACLSQAQAKINIVKGHAERLFIKTTDLFINRPPHQQTCRRYRR